MRLAPPAPVLVDLAVHGRTRDQLVAALAHPVESYLFVGPRGSGKQDAALALAAALVCPDGGCGVCAACLGVAAGRHPDVTVVERAGASISVEEARAVVGLAQRTPTAARRQVVVLLDFHLVERAAPVLLKTIEEPPGDTVFIVIAESVPATLVTVASRCVTVTFAPLSEAELRAALAREGVEPAAAQRAARAAGGRLDRARLLARDEDFAEREARWRSVPERLDGTGATTAVLAAELLSGGEDLVELVRAAQAEELERLEAEAKDAGERRITGRQVIEERHRREQRRVRTDELRTGLGVLAAAYRSRLSGPLPPHRRAAVVGAIAAIEEAARSLIRNPTEALLLEALLLRLDEVR